MKRKIDFLIVGAGFSGLVLAERLATQMGKSCLVAEKRHHIGGNAYDEKDKAGVLIHKYGPHYFRTNSPRIHEYLALFTEWRPTDYKILSWANGRHWNFPINLNTYEQLIGKPSSEEEFSEYLTKKRVPIDVPRNSEEVIISQVGWELYELFFRNYTIKQWQRHPRDLDASVCGRIPIRKNRDDRYLSENFQALPKEGYSCMFTRMAMSSPLIEIVVNTDYRAIIGEVDYKHLIFTGPIDEYYDYCYGALPYRSLRFVPETFDANQLVEREQIAGKRGFWQRALQINYPNDEDFTRIVEMKHATLQSCLNTTIVREYPDSYTIGKEPYYPIPASDTRCLYELYAERARHEMNVSFVGRLATYRYYNMDQVVGAALALFENKLKKIT